MPALVQIMAWRRPGDRPLSEPMMVSLPTHICVARPQWVKGGYHVMPPYHCRECCLRTNTNWHSLRIAQHRIDSNYFVFVRCHFRISSQANTNVLKCSKHSYWPCESILFVLRRITSPNVVSIRVSSYWFVSHRCTFVSHRCTFALGFAACPLRLSTLQYDAQRSYCNIGSHMFALVHISSYRVLITS